MLDSRAVPLASLGWSLSVIALLLKFGLLSPPSSLPIERQDPLSLSIAVLKQSETFKASTLGEAGITPNEVLAWRLIFNSPSRDEVFRDILTTGSPSGRLYALAGLWFGDANEFRVSAKALGTRSGTVTTVRGCIVSSEPLRELIREIESGSWSREFLAAGRIVMVR